jgi:hypothetical protein
MSQSPQQGPLATFTSHIAGRNARISIWPDRVESVRPGRLLTTNILLVVLAICTIGLALLAPSCRPRFSALDSQMLPIRSIQSVSSHRETVHTLVTLTAGPNSTMEMRVSQSEAEQIESLIRKLMLGSA